MCLVDLMELSAEDAALQISLEGMLRKKQAAAEARAIRGGVRIKSLTPVAVELASPPRCSAVTGSYLEMAA